MLQFLKEWQPLWDAFSVFATVFLTIAVLLLAREQNKISRNQMRIDAHQKRFEAYDAIMVFFASITVNGTTDQEALRRMLQGTKHAKFLFDSKARITELVRELYLKGLDLEYCEKNKASFMTVDGEAQRKALIKEGTEIRKWFETKRDEVDRVFEPYLKIDET